LIKANWKNSSGGLSAVFVLAAVTPLIFAPPARAADYDIGSIHITQPWARATPKGASSGAAYMTITNNGKTPDRVSCVSSDASALCQIHTMAMEDGVMKMRPVEGGLEIKPGRDGHAQAFHFPRHAVEPQAPAAVGQDGEGYTQIRERRDDQR
jgi:hypothetical protein